jgi:hypothetical protein
MRKTPTMSSTRIASFLVFAVLWSVPAFSQTVAPIRANSFEIGGFVGSSYGIDKYRVMGGGNVSYAVTKRLLPYVEYSYFPGIPKLQVNPVGSSHVDTAYSFNLHDLHAGVHYRFTYRESKLVPYAVFGVGMVHSGKVQAVTTDYTVSPPQVYPSTSYASTTDFAVNFGGGLRYYFDQRWGIRAEAKAYKPTGFFNQVFGKVEFGIFYQK